MEQRLLLGLKKYFGKTEKSWDKLNDALDVPFASGKGYKYFIEKYVLKRELESFEDIVEEKEEEIVDSEFTLRFGLVSDTHIGSKKQQITRLNEAYKRFKDEGITNVYHCGDVFEGIKMRAGHEQECFLHGVDDMVDYAEVNYPYEEGIKTNMISGNHDASTIKVAGIDACAMLANRRDDINYLGKLFAVVDIKGAKLQLNHPLDGSAYAYSHASQKFIDAMDEDERPHILATGHHHKYVSFYYRNVHALEVPCFQGLTSWMKGKRLRAEYGYLIINVDVSNNKIVRFIPEFYPFKPINEDYPK